MTTASHSLHCTCVICVLNSLRRYYVSEPVLSMACALSCFTQRSARDPTTGRVDVHHYSGGKMSRRNTSRTAAYREQVSRDSYMRRAHAALDELTVGILEMEREWGLLRSLLPNGALAPYRKTWSYGGRLKDGRDIGNWYYAVVMRVLFDSGLTDHDGCGDVLLGDVVEAVFQLGYNLAREHPYTEFARLVDAAVLWVERIADYTTKLGYWLTSREMAGVLL